MNTVEAADNDCLRLNGLECVQCYRNAYGRI